MILTDGWGRNIDYLRISVTDQCNLRCGYCMPVLSRRCHVSKADILSFEEIFQLASAAVAAGVKKIRITGGEPLVRNNIVRLCRMLASIDGLEELTLTTNAVRLKQLAQPLKNAGVQRINVSLDTLNRTTFKKITGMDCLPDVLAGIKEAQRIGLMPIKINTVVMRGINDHEIQELAELSLNKPYQVRFIEMMPFDGSKHFNFNRLYMPVREIIQNINGFERAHPMLPQKYSGPASLYSMPGAKGCIGFIGALSRHFCKNCNRMRLTAGGRLRTCLFASAEMDMKTPLRNGADQTDLINFFQNAILAKPRQHPSVVDSFDRFQDRGMYSIGG